MAKGQVTEEDLASGLEKLSGFGALGGAPRIRRDSPFRDSSVQSPKTIDLAPVVEERPPSPSVELRPDAPRSEKEVVVAPVRSKPATPPKREKRESPTSQKQVGQRKADIFTERVTLQMSPEMRDEVDELARKLQRMKSSKEERITANSVMRVAITALLDRFELKPGEAPNNEDELLALVTKR